MTQFQKSGPDRCRMRKPEKGRPESAWLGKSAYGSDNIRVLLATGWEIVDDPFNLLRGDYGQESNGQKPVVVGLDPDKTETNKAVEVQPKRGPGRPRNTDRHAKK